MNYKKMNRKIMYKYNVHPLIPGYSPFGYFQIFIVECFYDLSCV